MGSGHSSYTRYKNDFELVIRATKDLEHLLETEFGAPSGKQIGLHDKISFVQSAASISPTAVRKMRYLVTLRNKLVHDHDFNELPDWKDFAQSYDQVAKELYEKVRERRGDNNSSCAIS
uniref:DUF4145 domain-containing protein n=1 Tax=Cyclophora tenuis TaxID=216820 RepID=A0A7S1D167_CYCTE|mmetsp:Transcript_14691/g.24895  ORF Transcript_14691/g.24895 Transcript_14691/m.24895 type:complete len:119 (+) Transcript_14691:25-381(+)